MDDWNGDPVFLDHSLNIHMEKLHCSIWCFVSALDGSVVEQNWWTTLSKQPCSLDIYFIFMHLADVSLSMLEEVLIGVFRLIARITFHQLSLSVLEQSMLLQGLLKDLCIWCAHTVVLLDKGTSFSKILVGSNSNKQAKVGEHQCWRPSNTCAVMDVECVTFLLDQVIHVLGSIEKLFNVIILILITDWITHDRIDAYLFIFLYHLWPEYTS